MSSRRSNRRLFLAGSAAALTSPWWGLPLGNGAELPVPAPTSSCDDRLQGRVRKTLKIGMVNVEGDLAARFRAAQTAGFDGIEMDSPGLNVKETRAAIAATGLPVDGTVCSTHWQKTHTHPDPQIRREALADLQTALRDTHAIGGHTTLLVVGHGKDGPESEIWPRAIENIRQALPLAAELGIYIAIENVWNRFLYDHDGGADQSAEKYVRFVDELNSPWVGMQLDIGNHWKYGDMGGWVRTLGRRVVKLDLKGYSRARQDWTDIGEDDIDWADVRRALLEINFYGWAAAEVGGGDVARLTKVAGQIDEVLKLK